HQLRFARQFDCEDRTGRSPDHHARLDWQFRQGRLSIQSVMKCLRAIGILLIAAFMAGDAPAATLQVEIVPTMSGEGLQPASLRYQTSAGETYSVTRVSYFLSDFALQNHDGSWLELTNSAGWFDFEQNRDKLRLDGIPSGDYQSIRFH